MKGQSNRAQVRHRVAVEAARLLYRREIKEYFQAKREAARRQGTPHLPSNREVHQQLLLIARKIEGDEHTHRLAAMRRQAVALMELLEPFQPRLIGSTYTGHIRPGSDIDLHVHGDEIEPVLEVRQRAGFSFSVEHVHSRKGNFTHVRLPGESEVEITLYPEEALHTVPRCGITGGPMARGSLAQVRQLLAAEPPPPRWRLPVDLEERLPELSACRGVLQNHYHHLDVYDHTLEVVRGLQALIDSGFQRLERWAPQLRELDTDLLLLAGYCHDLAKPQTQTFARDGRIRFPDHDRLGAEMAGRIGPRLGLDAARCQALVALVDCHLEAVRIPSEDSPPSRTQRLFRRTGQHLPLLALLSLADVEASRGPAQSAHALEEHERFVHELLEDFYEGGFLAHPCLPVSRDDLVEQLGVTRPKEQDRLLEWLLDAFVDGEFEGVEDGLALAGELLSSPHP